MGQVLQNIVEGWPQGVDTTSSPDSVVPGASPRARNTALTYVAAGKAVVRKRKGARMMNGTAVTGSAPFIGQAEFRYLASGSFTHYHILLTDTGRVEHMGTDGTLTNVATTLTSGTHYPFFAQANNCLFIVNGQDRVKVTVVSAALVLQNFGIAEPSGAPALADAGSGSNHNGTYEGRYTFVNGNTGEESSASPTSATVTLTNNAINWSSVAASADSQVTKRNLYIRNTATMPNGVFYFVGAINDNSATTTSTDVLDTALTIIGPDTDANDRPPSGVKYACWQRNRMFVADDNNIYWSNDNHPEAFDPENFKPVNPKDGQKISGLWSITEDTLLIGKTGSMWILKGNDPRTWTIEVLHPDIGVVAPRSLTINNGIVRWWSLQGPMEWEIGSGSPSPIGQLTIQQTMSEAGVNYSRLDQITSVVSTIQQRTYFAAPGASQTRNTYILPYSNRLGRFESDSWDIMDAASLGVANDSSGVPQVYLGNYGGQVFRLWDTDSDGVPSGTDTGTFIASAASITTITDLTAAFLTTGAGLKERKVTVLNSDGRMVGSTRPRISSNTATALTLSSAIAGLAIGSTYTYIVGGPAFEFDTHWEMFGQPFLKKRWEFFYIQMEAAVSSTTLDIDIAFELDPNNRRSLNFTSPAGAIWGVFLWGQAVWGGVTSALKRLRVAKTGVKARARMFNFYPDQAFTIYRTGFRAEALGDKGL